MSKSPDRFVEGTYPYFLIRGEGAYVYDEEDNKFIDYPLALGAITLGHAHPKVVEAVVSQVKNGTLFTLPSTLEADAAQLVLRLSPSTDQVRFSKTGSEVCSAAIKLARAATNREEIAACGYHGWHDWFTVSTDKKLGIPASYRKLIHKFTYNDIDSLERIMAEHPLAAVIMEPCIYHEPKDDFLERVHQLCLSYNTLFILDEMVTGGRFPEGSAQKYFGIEPDLSTFGKGIANGMPLAALCGKRQYMQLFEDACFFSTTFGGETASLAACEATLTELLKPGKIDEMWRVGRILQNEYNRLADSMGLETSCEGFPCRTMFMFPTPAHKSLFWQECIKRGVLFGYAQFVSLAHDEKIIYDTLAVIKEAFRVLKIHWDHPQGALEGPVAKEVFRLVATKEMVNR